METRYLSITLPDASSYSIPVNFTLEGQGLRLKVYPNNFLASSE